MKKLMIALFCSAASMSAVAGNAAPAKVAQCIACHGADFNSPAGVIPKLAGQHAAYLEHALKTYKRGEGNNGRNDPTMMMSVKDLSSKDIAEIAAYISKLPGSLVVKR